MTSRQTETVSLTVGSTHSQAGKFKSNPEATRRGSENVACAWLRHDRLGVNLGALPKCGGLR